MEPAKDTQNDSQTLYSILWAILIWCCFLACGVFLYQWGADAWDLRKALTKSAIVAVCVGGFAGGWLWLLAIRKRQPVKKRDLPSQPPNED